MNKYEFIPLVLMKPDQAGVPEYLQLSHCQGPEGTVALPDLPRGLPGPGSHCSPWGCPSLPRQCRAELVSSSCSPAWPSYIWVVSQGLTLGCGLTSWLNPGPVPSQPGRLVNPTCGPRVWAARLHYQVPK